MIKQAQGRQRICGAGNRCTQPLYRFGLYGTQVTPMTKTTKAKDTQKYCNCWKHCMGGRMVSRSTYYSHTQYRCSNAQQTSTQQSQPAVQNLVPGTLDTHQDKRQRMGPSLPMATEPLSLHSIQMHLHSIVCVILRDISSNQ